MTQHTRLMQRQQFVTWLGSCLLAVEGSRLLLHYLAPLLYDTTSSDGEGWGIKSSVLHRATSFIILWSLYVGSKY